MMRIVGTLLALALGLSFWGIALADPDLSWHLLGGEYISEYHRVPSEDFINALRPSWHDYHWLYQLSVYQLYHAGGLSALMIGWGVSSAIFFVLLYRLALRSHPPVWAFLLCALVYLVLQPSWVLRPQAPSLVVLFLTQYLLEKRPRFELPALLSLSVLIVNIHVFWIFIPVLWFLSRVLPRWWDEALSPFYAWGGLALLSLAGLISPYGLAGDWELGSLLRNYAVLWDYLFLQPSVKARVVEMVSPFALSGYIGPLLVVVLLIVVVHLRLGSLRQHPGALGFLLLSLLLAVLSAKYLGLLGIALFFALPKLVSLEKLLQLRSVRAGASLVMLLSLGYLCWFACDHLPDEVRLVRDLQRRFPLKECEAIVSQAEHGRETRVLTSFNSGGWCAFAMQQAARREQDGEPRQFRVLVDNRTQGVPEEFYREAFELFELKGRWQRTLSEWSYDYLVVPKSKPLAELLRLSADSWPIVAEGPAYLVFQKPRA